VNNSGNDSSITGVAITKGVEADKFERFERWLQENGAQFDMLELREYETNDGVSAEEEDGSSVSAMQTDNIDDTAEEKKEPTKSNGIDSSDNSQKTGENGDESSEMRGVHARCTIPPNTVCVAVPRKCLITVEMGQGTDIGQAILNSDLDLDAPKHIFLMVFLLWDRKVNGSKSFFKPYYDILPQTLHNMPIFWSEEELSYLEGSYLLAQIADRNDAITDDYHAICEVAPELADVATLDEFKWARMCVCSRNFGLQIDGHRTSALVPHADMLNHYRPRETKWTFDDERQAFTITTLQTIPSGAQVYDSYGQKCNHRFLLNYGFAVEDNRELDGFCPNEVPIELGVVPDDPLYDAKYEFWTRGEGSSSGGSGVNGVGGSMGHNAVSVLAAAVAAAGRNKSLDSAAVLAEAVANAAASSTSSSLNNGAMSNLRGDGHPHSLGTDSSGSTTSSLPSVKRVRVCVSNNENTRILFSMLRVLACNEEELRAISSAPSSSIADIGGPGCVSRALLGLSSAGGSSISSPSSAYYRTCRDVRHPLNLRNERAAMTHLLDVIGRALAIYPTTLAQDVSDLLDERRYPRFSNKRHARIQVRGEKEVLHHFAQWARTALEIMDVIERELAFQRGEPELHRDEVKVGDGGVGGFDYVISAIEEEEGMGGNLHHTIVRYCSDVLGSLRREEMKNLKRFKMMGSVNRPSGYP